MVILESVRDLFSPSHRRLMALSAILWGFGDVGAQAITHYSVTHRRAKEFKDKDEEFISFWKKDAEFKIDWFRVYITSSFGLGCCMGPTALYWFSKSLQRSMGFFQYQPTTPQLPVVLDGLFGTLSTAAFFPFMGSFEALNRAEFPFKGSWHGPNWSWEQAKEDLKRGFTPALLLGGVMLPAKVITITRFVPAPYQLHCMSLVGLVGSCSLSWIELQQQKDGRRSNV